MATLTSTRAATGFPVDGVGEGQSLKVAYGTYTLAANPSQNDVIQECWLPAFARVLGGWVQAKDIDTGTESFDADVGWEANGAEAADPDGFGNFGVWTGDAVTDLRPEVGVYFPLGGVLFTTGPQKFTRQTRVSLTVNAAANATGTGQITVVVLYVMDYTE